MVTVPLVAVGTTSLVALSLVAVGTTPSPVLLGLGEGWLVALSLVAIGSVGCASETTVGSASSLGRFPLRRRGSLSGSFGNHS